LANGLLLAEQGHIFILRTPAFDMIQMILHSEMLDRHDPVASRLEPPYQVNIFSYRRLNVVFIKSINIQQSTLKAGKIASLDRTDAQHTDDTARKRSKRNIKCLFHKLTPIFPY